MAFFFIWQHIRKAKCRFFSTEIFYFSILRLLHCDLLDVFQKVNEEKHLRIEKTNAKRVKKIIDFHASIYTVYNLELDSGFYARVIGLIIIIFIKFLQMKQFLPVQLKL